MLTILMLALFVGYTGIATAQSQNMDKLHSEINLELMNENLQKLSALLAKMSDLLAKGNLDAQHTAKCAEILSDVSHIMTEMTTSENRANHTKYQQKIEKVEKNGTTSKNKKNISPVGQGAAKRHGCRRFIISFFYSYQHLFRLRPEGKHPWEIFG